MKIRRRKRVQRVLSFFKNNFSFHEPYRVIVDGTFCQAALKNKFNIEDQIPRYFGSEVKFFTTSCAIDETEILGKHFLYDLFISDDVWTETGPALHGAMLIVKKFQVTSCGHEKNPISAAQCLHSLLASHDNKEHFILATQDKALKEKVRELPRCPILSLVQSALTMEKPSRVNVVEASGDIEHTKEREVADLKIIKSQVLGPDPVARKRKRPKGPNPLSCKKKQKKPGVGPTKKDETDIKKRSRKRVKPTLPKHVSVLLQKSN